MKTKTLLAMTLLLASGTASAERADYTYFNSDGSIESTRNVDNSIRAFDDQQINQLLQQSYQQQMIMEQQQENRLIQQQNRLIQQQMRDQQQRNWRNQQPRGLDTRILLQGEPVRLNSYYDR